MGRFLISPELKNSGALFSTSPASWQQTIIGRIVVRPCLMFYSTMWYSVRLSSMGDQDKSLRLLRITNHSFCYTCTAVCPWPLLHRCTVWYPNGNIHDKDVFDEVIREVVQAYICDIVMARESHSHLGYEAFSVTPQTVCRLLWTLYLYWLSGYHPLRLLRQWNYPIMPGLEESVKESRKSDWTTVLTPTVFDPVIDGGKRRGKGSR